MKPVIIIAIVAIVAVIAFLWVRSRRSSPPAVVKPVEPVYAPGMNVDVYALADSPSGKFGDKTESFVHPGTIDYSDVASTFFGKYRYDFGLNISGMLKVPAGTHKWVAGHDDGVIFTLGSQKAGNYILTPYIEDVEIITIETVEKFVPFTIQYYQSQGGAALTLKMDGVIVPASSFFH